jgi:hypothetical protein
VAQSAFVLQYVIVALFVAAATRPASGGGATEKSGYLGSTGCARCHAAQFETQANTGHARSLHIAASHPLISSMLSSEWLTRPPKYRFRFQRLKEQFRVQAHDGQDRMEIPVEWAFGAGDQAVTFVSRVNREWYLEHYFTFYSALGRMAPTAGHQALRPKTLPEAMGLPYKTTDPDTGIQGCFECHSTGPVRPDAQGALQPLELGVRCEACHGPGREHATVSARGDVGKARQLIGNPKRISATALNEFCGRCHRPPGSPGAAIDWNYSWNVRHQPVYLTQSKCMQNSRGRLSCFTCHEPHQPLQKNSGSYNERCLACHAAKDALAPADICRTQNRANCIDCHMPRVSPQPALRFTNHWIGVYGEGSKLKPR